MREYNISELRCMEVINVCNGKRLGYPTDFTLELSEDCPRVTALCVEREKSWLCFGGDAMEIPWCHVECVGEDSILVKLTEEQCGCFSCKRRRRK